MKISQEGFYLRKKRLIILVTLSISYIGYSLFGQLYSLFQGKLSEDKLETLIAEIGQRYGDLASSDTYDTFEKTFQIMRIQNDYFLMSHFITILGFVLGLLGVMQMFKGKNIGFHFYIIYSIIATFGLFVYIPFSQIPVVMVVTNAFVSFAFILLYYRFRIWDLEVE